MSAWVSSATFGETVGTLQGDDGQIAKAVSDHAAPDLLHTLCAGLETDVSNADGNLPSPDGQVTDYLSEAYHDEQAAAQSCFQGATGSASLLTQSAEERGHAQALISAAFARVIEITGAVPVTTTTTSSGADIDGF